MTYWGRSGTSGSSFAVNFNRAMSGTFVAAGQTLDSVEIYCSSSTNAQLRVAVYIGGTLTDPAGAALLEDLGTITAPTTAGWTTVASVTNPTIPANAIVWIYVHGQNGNVSVYASSSSADSEDFQSERGRVDMNAGNDPATAPPDPLPSGTFGNYWYSFRLNYSASSDPTINNVDGDNAVNQYQQAIVDVSGFTEGITTATLGGVACTIPENDPADDQITVGMPGTGLATGTYDLVISGSTESDTISGISYTVTHEFTTPYEPVDSNSLFADQLLTSDSYHRIVTPPSNGTLDTATAESQSLWGNDVDDIYTPDEGFTGDDTVRLEILYSDGTTSQWTATITVEEPDTVGPVVQSVAVPTAGTYTPGENLDFTATMDEASFVTGTPALGLLIGGSARQANYVSGDGTQALLFRYPVQSGDEDTDGIEVTGLTLDGGTIKDSAGNDADLTLNAVGDTSGVLVDGVGPVISINAITTTNTAPIGSGSAGDAVSLTLDLEGVDVTHTSSYNITPDGGTWNQQLPELALGEYTMTLNGEDAVGNPAVERSALLRIVDEIVIEQGGLFRALFKPAARSVNKSLFR